MWVPIFGLYLTFPFLLFPDGHLPSPRWRWVARASVVVTVLWSIAFALQGEDYTDALNRSAPNPYAIEGLTPFFDLARMVVAVAFISLVGICVASLVVRFRRGRGDERQQIKWLMVAGALFVVYLAIPIEHGDGGWVDATMGVMLALMPVAIGISILKYRLYDIDLVIRKTFAYTALAAFITLVYVGVVVGVGAFLGGSDASNVPLQIAATAVVAMLFQPVRDRANRSRTGSCSAVARRRTRTLTRFSERVGGTYATEDVLARIARVMAEGSAPIASTSGSTSVGSPPRGVVAG